MFQGILSVSRLYPFMLWTAQKHKNIHFSCEIDQNGLYFDETLPLQFAVAPVVYQVIPEPCIYICQFREFESLRAYTRIHS